MASKEALKNLKNYIKKYVCNYEKEYTPLDREKYFFKEIFEVIEKELEVLEILKRIDWLIYNNVDKNDFNWYIDTNKSMKLTKEEVEKIKDWLKGK